MGKKPLRLLDAFQMLPQNDSHPLTGCFGRTGDGRRYQLKLPLLADCEFDVVPGSRQRQILDGPTELTGAYSQRQPPAINGRSL